MGYPTRGIINQDTVKDNGYVMTDGKSHRNGNCFIYKRAHLWAEFWRELAIKWKICCSAPPCSWFTIQEKVDRNRYSNEIEKMTIHKGIGSIKVDTHEDNIPMHQFAQEKRFRLLYYLSGWQQTDCFWKIITEQG